jgi:hypothetical protein
MNEKSLKEEKGRHLIQYVALVIVLLTTCRTVLWTTILGAN